MCLKQSILVLLVLALSVQFLACSEEWNVGTPDPDDAELSKLNPGVLHNAILDEFSKDNVLFGPKASREEGTKRFVRAANDVLSDMGLEYSIDREFVDGIMAEFKRIKRETGYDFCNPGGDQKLVIDYLESSGTIEAERADLLRDCFRGISNAKYDELSEPWLTARIVAIDDPAIEIGLYSTEWWIEYYSYMEEYVEDHPELQGWWDDWKKKIREWGIIGTDAVGVIVASPSGPVGAVVGGALASVAFTIAWPPEN